MLQVKPIEYQLKKLKSELNDELTRILNYWMKNTPDNEYGGFLGQIDAEDKVVPGSPKGSVLNARILWSFSAAYNLNKNPEYLQYAERAYQYITSHFIDKEFGGVYWTVDHKGNPLDTKKQVYASAFAIYGLSEYYHASGNEEAKTTAISFYKLLVEHSYDTVRTGYLEAFTCEWEQINDLRLSAKDANEKKTMNTHLHVLEGYANLYSIWPDDGLKAQIITLLHNFLDRFINPETYHLNLFFDEDWNRRSALVSYGHDIEAAWLLLEAAEIIKHGPLIERLKDISIKIAKASLNGLDADSGLWYEYEPSDNHLVKEKHWWVQAEAIVGFYNTWQITGDEKFLELAEKTWEFVKKNIIDPKNGEWVWGIGENGNVMPNEDKAGIWKCPYHNSRACIEIVKR